MTAILKRPIVTEKMTEMQEKGRYAFEVEKWLRTKLPLPARLRRNSMSRWSMFARRCTRGKRRRR